VPIRVLDIDDASLNEIGQWPWPRTVVAQLVDRLREAGAAVIAFDIDFAEPDRTPPILLLPLLGQNGVGNAEAERLLAALPDPDQQLAEAMGALPVVTGFILTDRGQTPPPLPKAGVSPLWGKSRSAMATAFRRRFQICPGWKPRRLETAFSTNLSIGTMSFAGFRWFCGSAKSRIRPSPPRRSGSLSARAATSVARQEQMPRRASAKRPG
jgi:hypothetical protein